MADETTGQATAPQPKTAQKSAPKADGDGKVRRGKKRFKPSKRTRSNEQQIPKEALEVPQAVAALKKFKGPKFDQSVEVSMHLGLDTKHADQNLRGSVSLPKGIGKTKRVIAFCGPDQVEAAKAAGAVEAGSTDLAEKIEKGWMDFDVAVASPEIMRDIAKLGRVLGPKGLMPSPKAGTVTKDVAGAVQEYSAGKVEYRTEKGGNVQAVIGKMSFSEGDLAENLSYFIETIEKLRPSAVKGVYIKKITISGTMTPGVQVAYAQASE